MHVGDIIFVGGAVVLVALYVFAARWHRNRELRRVKAALAQRGLEALLTEIAEKQSALEAEMRHMKANAGALENRNALAGTQVGLFEAMQELSEYEALVRELTAKSPPVVSGRRGGIRESSGAVG